MNAVFNLLLKEREDRSTKLYSQQLFEGRGRGEGGLSHSIRREFQSVF